MKGVLRFPAAATDISNPVFYELVIFNMPATTPFN